MSNCSQVPDSARSAPSEFKRRSFLGLGALAAAATLIPGRPVKSESAALAGPGDSIRGPKNVIFMVSDGMSAGVLSLAEAFSQQVRGRGTHWIELLKNPASTHGLMDTASLNSLVTDSAAASSAWGSGVRVNNGSLNVLPDGTKLVPLAQVLRDNGRLMGLITTATVTHATPAGFAACQAKRNDEAMIAPQYLDLVDVILGGGSEFFLPEEREDGADILAQYVDSGYQICRTPDDLASVAGKPRVLGLFSKGFLPYVIDRETSGVKTPTLTEMLQASLSSLADREAGFMLQVEGARIDHAAHHNDIATLLWEQLDFDDAVGAALEFAAERGDTLVIVTSDHGNANPGLNGMGQGYADSTRTFRRVARAKASFESLQLWAKAQKGGVQAIRPATWAQRVIAATGLVPSESELAATLALLQDEDAPVWNDQRTNFWAVLGQITGNRTGVGWTGISHTADPTIITSIGPGASAFSGYVRNDEIFGHLLDCWNIAFRNPTPAPTVEA